MKEAILGKALSVFTRAQQMAYLRTRPHEKKVGEVISFASSSGDWCNWLKSTPAQYIVLGIAEDIGVRANYGKGGAHTAWGPFLSAFLNMQSNRYLPAGSLGILGVLTASQTDTAETNSSHTIPFLREQVAHLDDQVCALVAHIASLEKTPIIVGGGHNNAYPILKGFCQAHQLTKGMHAINLDAHTDLREREGRHSGNGFSYALHHGQLKKYAVIGAHQYYTPATVCEALLQDARVRVWWYEQIFLATHSNKSPLVCAYRDALDEACSWLRGAPIGMELDLDAMAGAPTSAQSPYGLSGEQVRLYVCRTTQAIRPVYFHLCEGIYTHENKAICPLTGKYMAYLVADFLACSCRDAGVKDKTINYYTL